MDNQLYKVWIDTTKYNFKDTQLATGKFIGKIIVEGPNKFVFKKQPNNSTVVIPYDCILLIVPIDSENIELS